MGLNFQYYDDLQPKIRAGIINEHECMEYTHLPPKFQYNTVYTARFAREEPMWNVDAHLDAKRETGSDL